MKIFYILCCEKSITNNQLPYVTKTLSPLFVLLRTLTGSNTGILISLPIGSTEGLNSPNLVLKRDVILGRRRDLSPLSSSSSPSRTTMSNFPSLYLSSVDVFLEVFRRYTRKFISPLNAYSYTPIL